MPVYVHCALPKTNEKKQIENKNVRSMRKRVAWQENDRNRKMYEKLQIKCVSTFSNKMKNVCRKWRTTAKNQFLKVNFSICICILIWTILRSLKEEKNFRNFLVIALLFYVFGGKKNKKKFHFYGFSCQNFFFIQLTFFCSSTMIHGSQQW